MSSLACEMFLASTSASAGANDMYHAWGLLGAAVAGLIGLASVARWIKIAEHKEMIAASLALEQSASVMFVRLILNESKRVFEIADDHLPLALSQTRSASSQTHAPSPEPSRFDHFCRAIRAIPEEELDDRGHYADVIRESFSRIISENAERLLDAMSASGTSSMNSVLNPTGVRFSLEADGYLRFAEISRFDSQNRRLIAWYYRVWTLLWIICGVAMLASLGCVVAVLCERTWAETLGTVSLGGIVAVLSIGVIVFISAGALRHMILRRAHKHGDPDRAQRYLDDRRRRAKKSY